MWPSAYSVTGRVPKAESRSSRVGVRSGSDRCGDAGPERAIAAHDGNRYQGNRRSCGGAAGGGVVGGLIGLLVGAGALVIPGLGPVLVGGALASVLGVTGATAVVGAGVGAATGGILGGLVGSGISEEEARYFDESFRGGGTLVTVSAGARSVRLAASWRQAARTSGR